MTYDTIVIGAGLAGLIGGLRLAEAGQRVLLLAKGNGATHWANGAIGIANHERPLEYADTLRPPSHPYARTTPADLSAALNRVRALCAAADYPLVGQPDRNLPLPTAVGATLPAALVPATFLAGRLDADAPPGPLLIAGFRELRDFFPHIAAANLTAIGYEAAGVWLSLPPVQRRLDFTTTTFAHLFEDEAFQAAIARQLRSVRGAATRVGLPAVLGDRQAASVVTDLSARVGVPVFEIPTLPPSVPGIRLYSILSRVFQRAGGRLQLGGWVVRGAADGRRLRSVYTEAAAREASFTASAFLLATGGILGGGQRADHTGQIVETALGLPVRAPTDRQGWFGSRFIAGHAIHQAGITTDYDLRPLDASGAVVYDNVVVAGAALGGADLIRDGSYEGVALATGWRAAGILAGI